MLVNAKKMLEEAKEQNRAIPHFNINNLEWTKYILEAQEELKLPLILGVSEGAAKYMGGFNVVVALVKSLVTDLNITIPVALHLDHGSSFESCKKAIDAGFTSVMIDFSSHSLSENIEETKKVVEYAHERNVSVEAEIGRVGGQEDNEASQIIYADVEESIEFASKTGIDFLAPALGSVHGPYKGEPKLNFERMKEIGEATKLPLVLHGGTGIPDEMIQKAITNGICKININTDLQLVWSKAVRDFLNQDQTVYDPRKVISAGKDAIYNKVKEKTLLFYIDEK